MSMTPDLEKQQPPETSEGSILECLGDNPNATQGKYPVNQGTRQANGRSQNQETTRDTQPTRPIHKTMFGLKQTTIDPSYDPIAATYDYTKKYKPDPVFHEADQNARVWHVYNDEAAIFDADMIEEASDSLDILLVFAGLFSAVLTTFLVQTSQSLAPDNSGLTVALLQELVDLQRAQAKGISLESIPQARFNEPSSIDRWVNGLWFASLTLSLSSALVAVLIKQWVRYYRSRIAGSSRRRALIRQFRHNGFERWQVQLIIGVLPTVLHVSLFLFLTGLVLFLTTLDAVISIVIGAMTVLLMAIYVVSIALPVTVLHCPYRTPISDLIHRLFYYGRSLKQREGSDVVDRVDSAHVALSRLFWGTSNHSVRPIVAEAVTAVWASEYRRSSSPINSEKLKTLASSSFYHLHRQRPKEFLSDLPRLANCDWTGFIPEQSQTLQQKLLYFAIHNHPSNFGGDSLKEIANIQITALSSDPALGLLALSIGLRVRFKGDGDNDPVENTMSVASDKPFTWLLNHHSKLAMPKLHPVVWKRLQGREGWNIEGITLQNMSADLKALIKESRDLDCRNDYALLHQPMSLASFVLQERILDLMVAKFFKYDLKKLDEWLKRPFVQAYEDGGCLEESVGSKGVSTEGRAFHWGL